MSAPPAALLGCTVANPPPVAPGGYYTNGRSVCTAAGAKHLFHGVDRPSLEWDPNGNLISAADFKAMAGWHANAVRIALNQDFWLSGAALFSPTYAAVVDNAVKEAEAAGLDVILDLHWSDEGNLGVILSGKGQDKPTISDQQPMADVNSKRFWTEVAMKYKNDGHVLFELYNEPHNIPWQVWLHGGMTTYQVVGMQELYDAVRATGANNVVLAGGLSYAFDLSGVSANPIKGYNVIYASHPYKPQNAQPRWETSFGYLATYDTAPVITTEFGDGTASTCTGQWNSDLIKFNDDHEISWTAWAWFVADPCGFPSLIADWSGTPSVQGKPVKDALLGYAYQPGGKPDLTEAGGAGTGAGGRGEGGASVGSAGTDAAGATAGGSNGVTGGASGVTGGASGVTGASGAATGGASGSAGAGGMPIPAMN